MGPLSGLHWLHRKIIMTFFAFICHRIVCTESPGNEKNKNIIFYENFPNIIRDCNQLTTDSRLRWTGNVLNIKIVIYISNVFQVSGPFIPLLSQSISIAVHFHSKTSRFHCYSSLVIILSFFTQKKNNFFLHNRSVRRRIEWKSVNRTEQLETDTLLSDLSLKTKYRLRVVWDSVSYHFFFVLLGLSFENNIWLRRVSASDLHLKICFERQSKTEEGRRSRSWDSEDSSERCSGLPVLYTEHCLHASCDLFCSVPALETIWRNGCNGLHNNTEMIALAVIACNSEAQDCRSQK